MLDLFEFYPRKIDSAAEESIFFIQLTLPFLISGAVQTASRVAKIFESGTN
jgi:hypothetical protein